MADLTQWALIGVFLLTTLILVLYVRRRTSSEYMTALEIRVRTGSEYAEKVRNLVTEDPDFLPSIEILKETALNSDRRIRPVRKFLKKCDSILKKGKADEEEFTKILRLYDRIQPQVLGETYLVK